jgi:hypothetical protein
LPGLRAQQPQARSVRSSADQNLSSLCVSISQKCFTW